MFYRIAGVFVAVFALVQFGHIEKAQSAVSGSPDKGVSKSETSTHGGGCVCSSCCMPPSDTSTKDLPA